MSRPSYLSLRPFIRASSGCGNDRFLRLFQGGGITLKRNSETSENLPFPKSALLRNFVIHIACMGDIALTHNNQDNRRIPRTLHRSSRDFSGFEASILWACTQRRSRRRL